MSRPTRIHTNPSSRPTRRIPPALAVCLLAVAAHLAVVTEPARAQQQETQLLQIVLLTGSRSGSSDMSALPANTRKAIEDIRQFLPFESYSFLDASLLRSNQRASTRMSGPGETEYEIEVSFSKPADAGQLNVGRFLVIKHPKLLRVLLEPPRTGSSDRDAPVTAPTSAKSIIQTSFAAEVGKTVVVGTSRLNGGDEALIVLFTALP